MSWKLHIQSCMFSVRVCVAMKHVLWDVGSCDHVAIRRLAVLPGVCIRSVPWRDYVQHVCKDSYAPVKLSPDDVYLISQRCTVTTVSRQRSRHTCHINSSSNAVIAAICRECYNSVVVIFLDFFSRALSHSGVTRLMLLLNLFLFAQCISSIGQIIKSVCVCVCVSQSVTWNELNALQVAIFHWSSPNLPPR